MSVVVGILLLLTAVILVTLGTRARVGVPTLLRRAACGLTLALALALTPWTFNDAGAAAGYLLGVPALLSIAIVVADMSGRGVLVVTAVAGVLMLVWALLLALGIGLAFMPSALLLLTSVGLDLGAKRRLPMVGPQ